MPALHESLDELRNRISGLETEIATLAQTVRFLQDIFNTIRELREEDYANQKAVNEALLANLIDDLGNNEPTKAEAATMAALCRTASQPTEKK